MFRTLKYLPELLMGQIRNNNGKYKISIVK